MIGAAPANACRPINPLPLAVLALALMMPGARLAGAAGLDERKQRLLERLSAESFGERERATRALMRGAWLDNATLGAMLDAATSDEQRHRLLTVAQHQTIRRFRHRRFDAQEKQGAVGIRHQAQPAEDRPGRARSAVLVVGTIIGFPGYSHLQPGDRIIAMGEEPVPDDVDRDYLANRVEGLSPGDEVTFTLIRRGERREVTLTLVGKDALDASHEPRGRFGSGVKLSDHFLKPWRERRAALLAERSLGKSITVDQ